MTFYASFFAYSLDYSSTMSIINCINFKTDEKTATYIFASFMHNKAFTVRNIVMFEDLNIFQIVVNKTNLY